MIRGTDRPGSTLAVDWDVKHQTRYKLTNNEAIFLDQRLCQLFRWGTQWLSGRVLDKRPRGRGFKPHRRHCFVSLSKTNLPLLSTGST